MSLAAEIAALRAEIELIKSSRKPRSKLNRDGRGVLAVRVKEEVADTMRAIAKARGITLGSLIGDALMVVMNDPVNMLPENVPKFLPHRKPDHFHDGKTPRIKDPARNPIAEGYARSGMLIEAGAAVAMRAPAVEGKLSETVARPVVPRIVPKPSR